MHKYLPVTMVNYTNQESFRTSLVQITLHITMDNDVFECKLIFQEYFMKLPVVNRSFFLFFFCFFPLFLSPVASEETITQLYCCGDQNRVVCTRFVGMRSSQNGTDASELQSVQNLYLQAHQDKLKYINYSVMYQQH